MPPPPVITSNAANYTNPDPGWAFTDNNAVDSGI